MGVLYTSDQLVCGQANEWQFTCPISQMGSYVNKITGNEIDIFVEPKDIRSAFAIEIAQYFTKPSKCTSTMWEWGMMRRLFGIISLGPSDAYMRR